MNEIQSVQFEMLKVLNRICLKHNLSYYLAYGSCLGAVREKGFIPWDHDIDVAMPIKDAKQLLKYKEEFPEPYFLSSRYNDKVNKSIKYLVVDSSKKCHLMKGKQIVDPNARIGLDILPLYSCPTTKMGMAINVVRSHVLKILLGGVPQNHGKTFKVIANVILFVYGRGNKKAKIDRLEKKLQYKGKSDLLADYFGNSVSLFKTKTFKKKWFRKPTKLIFEQQTFFGPTDTDNYLKTLYGDYMTPPPERDRESVTKLIIVEQ